MTESGPPGALRVAVIGGGITGLAAALALARPADGERAVAVTVLESEERLGGKVRTGTLEDRAVEFGPDGFLVRTPEASDLCRQLGLGGDLVDPATTAARVWVGGRLRPLPPDLVWGAPVFPWRLWRQGVLSPAGIARAAIEPWARVPPPGADPALGPFVRDRLGREVMERLVDPLLSGIYGGPAETMSTAAVAPQLLEAVRQHGSLLRGLWAARRASAPAGAGPARPLFQTVRGGLGRLVGHAGSALPAGAVRLRTPARALSLADDGRVRVETSTDVLVVDGVVVATPAFEAARLLEGLAPAAAAALRGIVYAPVAIVTLAYAASVLPQPLPFSGFLVARGEGRLINACTAVDRKWPHLATAGTVLLRASVGGPRAAEAMEMSDAALVTTVHLELRRALGLRTGPRAVGITRWPQALPQYAVGHLERLAAAEVDLARVPRLAVTGAAFRGVGLPACIRQGAAAAQGLRRRLEVLGPGGAPAGGGLATGER
ncbi:MAG TPA: protoporphyrinogen oxidase [Candidatus Dormibacteraeota bacterium]|nr:protoporphyrinogen oxidase [Candidatus Dormibacteraeota bacterium]